jgi:hypothetical protein
VASEINIVCKFIEEQYHVELDETGFDEFVTYISRVLTKTNAFLKKFSGQVKDSFDMVLSVKLIRKENLANIKRLKQQLETKKGATRSTSKKPRQKSSAARTKEAPRNETTPEVSVTRKVMSSNGLNSNAAIEAPTPSESIERQPMSSKAPTKVKPVPNSIEPVAIVKRIPADEQSAEKSAKRAAYYARTAEHDEAGRAEAAGGGSMMPPERRQYPLRYPLTSHIKFFATISPDSIPDPNLKSYVERFLSHEPRIGSYGNCVKPVTSQERIKLDLPAGTYYKLKVTDANLQGKSMRMFGHVNKEPNSDPHQVNIMFADKVTIGGNQTHR